MGIKDYLQKTKEKYKEEKTYKGILKKRTTQAYKAINEQIKNQ
jgi:hypothetical protein